MGAYVSVEAPTQKAAEDAIRDLALSEDTPVFIGPGVAVFIDAEKPSPRS